MSNWQNKFKNNYEYKNVKCKSKLALLSIESTY